MGKRRRSVEKNSDEKRIRTTVAAEAGSTISTQVVLEEQVESISSVVEPVVETDGAQEAADADSGSSSADGGGAAKTSEATATRESDGTGSEETVPAQVSGFQLDRESLVFAAECHMAVLQDEDGDTPLHLAVVQANKHLVHHLVYLISRSSRNVDIANKLQQTPLHLAVITGQSDLIPLLLANNASSNLPDRLGRTGLHLAAERNYAECCAALLESRDIDIEVRNFDGYTPVHTGVFHNSFSALRQLLSAGASVSPCDGKSGRTPLHHAAEMGNSSMVQFLISHGADINATTYSGNTPLHSAAGRGHEHVVSALVTAGADTHLQNTEGDVAADVARVRNSVRTQGRQSAVTA